MISYAAGPTFVTLLRKEARPFPGRFATSVTRTETEGQRREKLRLPVFAGAPLSGRMRSSVRSAGCARDWANSLVRRAATGLGPGERFVAEALVKCTSAKPTKAIVRRNRWEPEATPENADGKRRPTAIVWSRTRVLDEGIHGCRDRSIRRKGLASDHGRRCDSHH
jgi:hypothetical protein